MTTEDKISTVCVELKCCFFTVRCLLLVSDGEGNIIKGVLVDNYDEEFGWKGFAFSSALSVCFSFLSKDGWLPF